MAQLDAIWKGFFARAAEVLAAEDPASAARLAQANAHWLQHTFGSHAIARGVALDVVQHQLGHVSRATTSVYVHSEDARRTGTGSGGHVLTSAAGLRILSRIRWHA